MLSAGGGNIEARFAERVSIGLPGLQATNQLLAVVPLHQLPPLFGRAVRGILGNNFIKDYVVEIDYAGRTLVFHPHGTYSLESEPKALPLENRDGIPYVPVEISLSKRDSFTGLFEIDSGSVGALSINRKRDDEDLRVRLKLKRVI
jgi:hypothetical protein